MATVVDPQANVDSLSARQVRLLLRTIADHKQHLDLAHDDAMRVARTGLRPAYLLDFDLLYMYMFEYDEHVNWAQEFQFLISSPDTQYIIGPGTQTELVRLRQRDRPGRVSASDIARRLPELARLLRAPNVVAYEDLLGSMEVDEDAYDVALATLDRWRRARKEEANQADALNWAAIVHLRRNLPRLAGIGFPYLLTGTEPLLREEVWDAALGAPISRGPAAAIYSQVLFDVFPDPTVAMRHTVDAAFRTAMVERDLRISPAYIDPDRHQDELDLESALEQGRIGDSLRAQLMSLREFVNDRVIYMAQRVYDNADLMAENVAQQQDPSRTGRPHESPRRLFDLIAGLDAAMAAEEETGAGDRGLASLWSTVLKLQVNEHDDYIVYELQDRGGRAGKPAYFSLEVHALTDAERLFVMRWPGELDAANVLKAVASSFERHDERNVELVIGTSADVLTFDAEIPVFLDEIVEAVADAHIESATSSDKGEFRWARFNGQAFDLYADVATEMPHDPVVGVFAPSVHAAHVTDLYQKSSARYLFAAWLRAALSHIANLVESPSTEDTRSRG